MTKEILTDSKMMDLFKGNERALVYYNYDTNNWGHSKYVNFDKENEAKLESLRESAVKFKDVLLSTPAYNANYELVAYVQTEVLVHDGRNCGSLIANPFYRKYPLTNDELEIFSRNWVRAANKILSRDIKTGKIIAPSDLWMVSNAKGINLNEVKAALQMGTILKNYRAAFLRTGDR